ncbi:MAG TPA: hypothetical protein VH253_11735 [Phycisphaerae bacterium]|nr:hypothetical protein [Phycisphaerae bacterium]
MRVDDEEVVEGAGADEEAETCGGHFDVWFGVRYNRGTAQTWLELARDSRKAASGLVLEEHFRSCLSRAYYAAYSKVAHELVTQSKTTFPPNREGPSHPGESGTGGIRRLIESNMTALKPERRTKLSEMIGRLYTLRIFADYRPSLGVGVRDAREAISIMNTVFDSF